MSSPHLAVGQSSSRLSATRIAGADAPRRKSHESAEIFLSPESSRPSDISYSDDSDSEFIPDMDTLSVGYTHMSNWYMDKWLNLMVVPQSQPLRKAWNTIVALLLIYTGTVFPYRLCFLEFKIPHESPDNSKFTLFEDVVDFLFWIDLCCGFFFTFTNNVGKEVFMFRTIVKRYLRGYFVLNLLACLPPSVFQTLLGIFLGEFPTSSGGSTVNRSFRLARIQRVTRLARLTRLTRLMKFLSFCKSNPLWRKVQTMRGVRIVNFTTGLFWIVHLVACGWYLVAAVHQPGTLDETWVGRRSFPDGSSLLEKDHVDQWIQAMYFVLTVFTTVGFGDMAAMTNQEIVYVSFMMLLGAVVHSIIVSEMINVVTSVDQRSVELDKHRKSLVAFGKNCELEPRLIEELCGRLERSGSAAVGGCDPDQVAELIVGNAPRRLLAKMPETMFRGRLLSNKFVQCCHVGARQLPPRFPVLLAASATRRRFDDGEMVYCFGDLSWNVYLVMDGVFSAVGRPDKKLGGTSSIDVEGVQLPQWPLKRCKKQQSVLFTHFNRLGLDLTSSPTGSRSPAAMLGNNNNNNNNNNNCVSNTPSKEKVSRGVRSHLCTAFFRSNTQTSLEDQPAEETLSPYIIYGTGSYFGETEITRAYGASNGTRLTCVRCEQAGHCLVIHRRALKKLMEDFPGFGEVWRQQARRREWHRKVLLSRLTHNVDVRTLAALTIQRIVRQKLFGCPMHVHSMRKRKGKTANAIDDVVLARTYQAYQNGFHEDNIPFRREGSNPTPRADRGTESFNSNPVSPYEGSSIALLRADMDKLRIEVSQQSVQLGQLQYTLEALREDIATMAARSTRPTPAPAWQEAIARRNIVSLDNSLHL